MISPQLTRKPCLTSLLVLLAACLSGVANAQPAALPFNPAQTIEQWGQVLYCQQAYAHVDNRSRVYGYDIEQCAAAEAAVLSGIAQFPASVQADMKKLAQRSANRIMANTRDITQVLESCRQACTKMAALAPAQPAGSMEPATPDHAEEGRP